MSESPCIQMSLEKSEYNQNSGYYKATFRISLEPHEDATEELFQKFDEAFETVRQTHPRATEISLIISTPDEGMPDPLKFPISEFDDLIFDKFFDFIHDIYSGDIAALTNFSTLIMDFTTIVSWAPGYRGTGNIPRSSVVRFQSD